MMVSQGKTQSVLEQLVSGDTEPIELTEDLVCGLLVGPGRISQRVRHEHQDYYFCSQECAEKFQSHPSAYLINGQYEVSSTQMEHVTSENDNESTVLDWAAVYTCPVHSAVELPGPGTCPKCGVAVEPRTLAFEDEQEDLEFDDTIWP